MGDKKGINVKRQRKWLWWRDAFIYSFGYC